MPSGALTVWGGRRCPRQTSFGCSSNPPGPLVWLCALPITWATPWQSSRDLWRGATDVPSTPQVCCYSPILQLSPENNCKSDTSEIFFSSSKKQKQKQIWSPRRTWTSLLSWRAALRSAGPFPARRRPTLTCFALRAASATTGGAATYG